MNIILKYQHKINKLALIADIICGLLIVLFVYAAFSKLYDYTQFKMQLRRSPFIASYAGIIAWLVPATELTIVGILTVKNTRLYGLYASGMLLLIFTLYIAGMLLTEEHLPCSCGGIIQQLSWQQHLVFNTFLMALCGWGIIIEHHYIKSKIKIIIPKH